MRSRRIFFASSCKQSCSSMTNHGQRPLNNKPLMKDPIVLMEARPRESHDGEDDARLLASGTCSRLAPLTRVQWTSKRCIGRQVMKASCQNEELRINSSLGQTFSLHSSIYASRFTTSRIYMLMDLESGAFSFPALE